MKTNSSRDGQQAYDALCRAWGSNPSKTSNPISAPAKSIPEDVRRASLTEEPLGSTSLLTESAVVANAPVKDTVLYLAYGSNLCAETFRGVRGIKPVSQVNVLVPELELCFDLAGIPYNEPCFANTRLRTVKPPWTAADHHQAQWQKGLVGVVYEVTKADYAKIIATEGGGTSYQDILVFCFEIPRGTNIIRPIPTTPPFKAHTLFSPSLPPTKPGEPSKPIGRPARPDPDYAQPSARYLKLITDGAAEHSMPLEYRNYLMRLSPYTITSKKQKLGQAIFALMWGPIIFIIIGLGKLFADENGKVPTWLGLMSNFVFAGAWMGYDMIFKPVFGDGERTQEKEDDEEHSRRNCLGEKQPLLYEV